MATVSFKDEASLGQVIQKAQLFSFGAAPISQFKEIVFAAGGNKFSSLCGIRFTSKADIEFKEFFIAFVCKLRSKIYRQQTNNPSQWFIFKKISSKEMHCMDKESTLAQYGFDVDLFFKSDYFQKALSKFGAAINKGLKTYVPEYVKAHGAEKAKDLLTSYDGQLDATVSDAVGRYTSAIEDSLQYLSSTRCNDKFYKLIDYDIKVEKEENMKKVNEASNKPMTLNDLKADIDEWLKTDPQWGSVIVRVGAPDGQLYAVDYTDVVDDAVGAYTIECGKKLKVPKNIHDSEDDIVAEASKWDCEVKAAEEDGQTVYEVHEKADNFWVATFHDEKSANAFAAEYPKLKEKILKSTKEAEAQKQLAEKEKLSEKELDEKELDEKIEEALKTIYS